MRFLFLITAIIFFGGLPSKLMAKDFNCDGVDSTAATIECFNKQLSIVQNSLNSAYENLSAQKEGENLVTLRTLQQDWLSYRDAQCDWDGAQADSESIQKIQQLSCLIRLTKQRAEILTNQNKKDPIEFSPFPRWVNVLSKDHPNVFWNHAGRIRGDLDCDGEEELALTGVVPTQNKDTEKSVTYALDVVLAITDNPAIGRPDAKIFRFPVSAEEDPASFCHEKADLDLYLVPAVKPDSEKIFSENICHTRLVVKNNNCRDISLLWSGKDYVLDIEQEDIADNL